MLTLPRGSAHEIEFAVQIRKKREHVSHFLHFWREKVSTIGRNFCPAGICPSRRLGTSPSIESVVSIERLLGKR